MERIFLTAEWRKLALANYVVEPDLLRPLVPCGTELDFFRDRCYVSLVGFMFLKTKLKGWTIPFHSDFEEVNLRFYVRRFATDGTWKRGVVFIKEIVPKPALTWTANLLYGEKYETMRMRHAWAVGSGLSVQYEWKSRRWNRLAIEAGIRPMEMIEQGEEEFILEHYWGYTKINDRTTSEYEVRHPRWQIYPVNRFTIDVDFEQVYGRPFTGLSTLTPQSVFLAEGSEISVHQGVRF